MNLTLVTYYGAKPDVLRKLIKKTHRVLSKAFTDAFEPYNEKQVHGTIIGLEGTRVGDYIINQNYLEQRRLLKAINLPRLFELINTSEHLPYTMQIGGYKHRADYPFTSRGQHPYLRSFSIQGDIAVAMGWPAQNGEYPLTLDKLRRSFNSANVLHKYHSSPTDIDNDFFFVLGRINRAKLNDLSIQVAQEAIRRHFEQQEPVYITIGRENLSFVAYNNTKLPWGECQVFTLPEAKSNTDQLFMMYDDPAA
jgi:hypothetical protein